jgi:hypothetical protein
MAGMHLAKLQASYITKGESDKLTECAKRLDAALETWMMDDLEEREGLPAHLIGKK